MFKLSRTRLILFLFPLVFITITLSCLYRSFGSLTIPVRSHSRQFVVSSPARLFASSTTQLRPQETPATNNNNNNSQKMSVKEIVESQIKENHIVVFSKSYCPYCRKAKALLKSLDEEPKVFELDQMDEGADWQAYLGDKTGQRTVPSIWVDGQFIGGSSDLEAKNKSGELAKILHP
ncbi:glutaredoxin [Meredithblackwellia eburnea MCA 4105]